MPLAPVIATRSGPSTMIVAPCPSFSLLINGMADSLYVGVVFAESVRAYL